MRRRTVFYLPLGFLLGISLPPVNAALPPAIQDVLRIAGPAVVRAAAFDSGGNLYLAGSTSGLEIAAPRTTFGPATGQHLFVAKIAPSRQSIVYIAEFGSSQSEEFGALAVDGMGSVYLAGYTKGSDFPITASAFQPHAPQGGGFILKLESTGTRITYSTFLDESPYTRIKALTVGPAGNIYAAGMTNGLTFPTTPQAYLRSVPAGVIAAEQTVGFVTELAQSGSTLVFSTLLGGTYDQDWINGIAVAVDGTIHVAGRSYSKDFPVTTGFSGEGTLYRDNTFRARLDSTGSRLLYSSLLGGTNPLGMVMDAQGNEWIVENVNESTFVMGWDANDVPRSPGTISSNTTASAMTILPNGHLVIGGATGSWDFPAVDSIMPCNANLPHDPNGTFNYSDLSAPQAFLMEIDTTGKTVFSTFLGGGSAGETGPVITTLAPDPKGTVLVAGTGVDPAFPGGVTLGSGQNGLLSFAFRLDFAAIAHGKPAPSCLVDGLTFVSAPAVRGSFATLFGSGLGPAEGLQFSLTTEGLVPTELGGVQVTVGGIAAPILYAQDRQVNFLVPQQLNQSADVCVIRAPEKTCIFTYVVSKSPAIFQVFDAGVFAILNQDGTLNTPQNPAERGSYISLYGAGFGGYTRTFPDGAVVDLPLAGLAEPVRAFFYDPRFHCPGIGGSCIFTQTYEGEVSFAGAAPFAVNGLTQINVKTPDTPVPGTGRLDLRLSDQEYARVTVSLK